MNMERSEVGGITIEATGKVRTLGVRSGNSPKTVPTHNTKTNHRGDLIEGELEEVLASEVQDLDFAGEGVRSNAGTVVATIRRVFVMLPDHSLERVQRVRNRDAPCGHSVRPLSLETSLWPH